VLKRLFVSSAVLAVSILAKDDAFTGKWALDKSVSTATADIPDGLRQEIKKKGDGYMVETVWREPGNGIAPLALLGIMTTQLALGLDGKETRNQIGPFMQVSKTSQNGNQLVTEWTAVVNGETITGHWTRTLSDDRRSMTLDIQETMTDGKANSGKLVFKRK